MLSEARREATRRVTEKQAATMSVRNFDSGGKHKASWSPPLAPTAADWAWWQECAAEAGDRADELTPRERAFIYSMATWRGAPSKRQLEWLVAIFSKLFGKAPA